MRTSSWNGAVVGAACTARAAGRIAALVALLGAGLLLGTVHARAAETGAKQAAPVKLSPYVRYAREHAKTGERMPVRVRPSSTTVHGVRGGARVAHH